MCLAAFFSMILAALVVAGFFCYDLQRQMRNAVAVEIRYLEAAMSTAPEAFLEKLASRGDGDRINRITWIDDDGQVLYDSYVDNESLENHRERPEVAQALEHGSGRSVRNSATLAEQTYYSAARLSDGTVIRVASTTKSALAVAVNTLPGMAALAVLAALSIMLFAKWQTRRIVEPINEIDPENPQAGQVYEELSPLVRRLMKQKETIRLQMDTLREKQEEFTAITENMREGFLVVDKHADVISYNSSAARILGLGARKKEGGSLNILCFNRSGIFCQVVNQALGGERAEQMLELNGRFYQIIANPVTEHGRSRGAVAVILDVTEQQNREELRREFSANVSHELKTPLTSISGYAEIMKNGLVQPQDIERFSEKIYREAQRLITLVGDIIKLSQLDEGKTELERKPLELHQAAAEVLHRLKDGAAAAGVDLVLKGEPAFVEGTAQILDEMIFNLCDNAIKYNRPGGYVEVTTGLDQGAPVISVKDNGIGIPESEQERIFERFYRVDKSRSRQIGGTGLGLSIVKHGAIYHKARVEMESTPGKGTVVWVVFPPVRSDFSAYATK